MASREIGRAGAADSSSDGSDDEEETQLDALKAGLFPCWIISDHLRCQISAGGEKVLVKC